MANPPPVRPWFRLTSIRPAPAPTPTPAPPPAPAPAPAPEPRPTMSLSTFRTASAPPSPHNQTQPQEKKTEQTPSSPPHRVVFPNSSSSSSMPSSPIQKTTQYSSSSSPEKTTANTSRVPIPTQSPKTIKQNVGSPMHSPNAGSNNSPPSPLTLPPSQFKTREEHSNKIPVEAEPKAVLVQKTVDVPKPWHNGNGELHRENQNHSNGELHRQTQNHSNGEFHRQTQNHSNSSHHGKHVTVKGREANKDKKLSDSEDSGMRVITIAGENRGAYMELVQSQKKHQPNYLHKKGNSIKVDGGESESSSAEEGKINKKEKNNKGRTKSSFPMAAYMNSNVQCVNNSLLYHASCSHHDPGVRLTLSKKPFGEGYHVKEHVDGRNI